MIKNEQEYELEINTHISPSRASYEVPIVSILTVFERRCISFRILANRDDSRCAPIQWETSLQSNAVSHWIGANLESALAIMDHATDAHFLYTIVTSLHCLLDDISWCAYHVLVITFIQFAALYIASRTATDRECPILHAICEGGCAPGIHTVPWWYLRPCTYQP